MHHRTDLIYYYDGSFEGLLCCVFRAVYQKEEPLNITPEEEAQPTLLETVFVDTEPDKAQRVLDSIPKKLGRDALRIVKLCYLSDLPDRELALLAFLRLVMPFEISSSLSLQPRLDTVKQPQSIPVTLPDPVPAVPEDAGRSVARIRIVVVLPAPLGPTKPCSSPSPMLRSR